jgi:hypothetical protein
LARLISERPVFVNQPDRLIEQLGWLAIMAALRSRFWTKITLESGVSTTLSNPGFAGFRDGMGRQSDLRYHGVTGGSLKRRIFGANNAGPAVFFRSAPLDDPAAIAKCATADMIEL